MHSALITSWLELRSVSANTNLKEVYSELVNIYLKNKKFEYLRKDFFWIKCSKYLMKFVSYFICTLNLPLNMNLDTWCRKRDRGV